MFKKIIVGGMLFACTVSAAMAQMRDGPGMFEHANTNHDGLVSLDEFKAARSDAFAKRDKNSDGVIDDTDMPKLASARPKVREAVERMSAKLDLDHDGRITQQEFIDGAVPIFTKADTSGDGMIDTTERDAIKEKAQKRIKERREG
jgi:hypothetical protein